MARTISRLVLVFDANSGKLSAFVDSVKKVLMVQGCSLCAITHGLAGEKDEWRSCREELGVPVDYLHRDEVPPVLKATVEGQLPCIVAEVQGEYVVLLGPDVLERCRGSVADLKGRLFFHMTARELELPNATAVAAAS
jgi:hypothetical protein